MSGARYIAVQGDKTQEISEPEVFSFLESGDADFVLRVAGLADGRVIIAKLGLKREEI